MSLKRPFDATTLPALIMKIMKGNFDPVPNIYSHELKKLLLSMLHLDPNQRPSAAQIMCHPVMIRIIFKLYLDVGSIPCVHSTENMSQKSSKVNSLDQNLFAKPTCKSSPVKKSKCSSIWLFDNKSSNIVNLPVLCEHAIKTASLGMNHKIGISESGLIISWIIPPTISMNSEANSPDTISVPFYTATIVDDRIAINIISVVCGQDFTVCLSGNGVVFSFGKASSGCLGMSSDTDVQQPRIVEALFGFDIKSIACGPRHVLALSEESEVFAWGYGSNGCLGLGSTEYQVLPQLVQVHKEKKPHKIYCGNDCSFIITEDLSLLACGSNRHNKLAMDSGEGHQTKEKSVKKIDESLTEKKSTKKSSETFQIEESRYFTLVKSEPLGSVKVISISTGKSHSVVLTDKGEVYSMGSNRFGQLGWGKEGLDYSMPHKVMKISDLKISQVNCGDFFTVVVTSNGVLYCWGKCPRFLNGNLETADSNQFNFFNDKCVQSVSCFAESCLVVGACL